MRGRYSRALRRRMILLGVGNLLWIVVIWALVGDLGRVANVMTALGRHVGPVILAGFGLSGIIWCGAIDLSVGTVIAVAGSVLGVLVVGGAPPTLSFVAIVAVCVMLSSINAALIRLLRVPPIILTLGGLVFYRGVALIVADLGIDGFSGSIPVPDESYRRPALEWANAIVWAVAVCVIVWELFGKTTRIWLALGDSEEACRLQGIQPGRVLMSAFAVGGLLLGLGALLYLTQLSTIEPARVAMGFELKVIGAVVVGGTNIFGGEGSYGGTILGAVFLFLFEQVLLFLDVDLFYRQVSSGAAILIFVGMDCYFQKKRKLLEELR